MMFKRELSVHSGEFQRNGFILLKDVISDEFMAYLKDFHRRCLRHRRALHQAQRREPRSPGRGHLRRLEAAVSGSAAGYRLIFKYRDDHAIAGPPRAKASVTPFRRDGRINSALDNRKTGAVGRSSLLEDQVKDNRNNQVMGLGGWVIEAGF